METMGLLGVTARRTPPGQGAGKEMVALAGTGKGQRRLTWAEGCRGEYCAPKGPSPPSCQQRHAPAQTPPGGT